VILLIRFVLAIDRTDDERTGQQQRKGVEITVDPGGNNHSLLNMTLCAGKCAGESCKTYVTPLDECYSSSLLFPNDTSWSGKDVHDTIVCQTKTLVRTIYDDTEDGTCLGDGGDVFRIPLNECVGPFGKPLPWGIFQLIGQANRNGGNIDPFSSLCQSRDSEEYW